MIGQRHKKKADIGAVQARRFNQQTIKFQIELFAYPSSQFIQDIQNGDKIILPTSVFKQLTAMNVIKSYQPLIFCLFNVHQKKSRYCGVYGYAPEQGRCYIPCWIFSKLGFKNHGSPILVSLVKQMAPSTRYVTQIIKLQPHKSKFLEIDNINSILKQKLQIYTCLCKGDKISIQVFGDEFKIDIIDIISKNQENPFCVVDQYIIIKYMKPKDYVESESLKKYQKGQLFQKQIGVRINEQRGE